MAKVKVQISIEDSLLSRADDMADEMYMSRSGFVSMALTQLCLQREAVKGITDIAVTMRRIADSGQIDDESRRELAAFESLARMLAGAGK